MSDDPGQLSPQPPEGRRGLWVIGFMLAVIIGLFVYSNWVHEFPFHRPSSVDALLMHHDNRQAGAGEGRSGKFNSERGGGSDVGSARAERRE